LTIDMVSPNFHTCLLIFFLIFFLGDIIDCLRLRQMWQMHWHYGE